MKTTILLGVALLGAAPGNTQVPISSPSFTYSQNFSSSSIPPGWSFFESGTLADESFATNNGNASIPNTYLLGTPSEYAFGGLRSDQLMPTVGVCFTNDMTDRTITDISLQFLAETWRVGAANRPDGLDFQINTNTGDLRSNEGWTTVDALAYRNPGQQTGGGNVKHSRSFAHTISGLSIAPGTTFCMRWLDLDAAGEDDAIGVDNFTVSSISSLAVELRTFSAKRAGAAVLLAFSTATETNNSHFVIERSADGRVFTEIGQLRGAGTTQEPQSYTFIDEQPLAGTNYYRLRPVDYDGTESFSPVISVVFDKADRLRLAPSPATDRVRISLDEAFSSDGVWDVYDPMGKPLLSGVWEAEHRGYELDVSSLPEGMYTFRLVVGMDVQVKLFWKM